MNTLKLRVKNYVLQWLNSLNHTDFEFPVLLIMYLLNDNTTVGICFKVTMETTEECVC